MKLGYSRGPRGQWRNGGARRVRIAGGPGLFWATIFSNTVSNYAENLR